MSREPESLVFAGTWRDAIPRALIFDPILDAVPVRLYMFLFTQISPTGQTRFPSYEDIARRLYLSKPTVIRAMHLLRATRWVTRAGEMRGADGRFIENAYLLHDEPLSMADAIRLDGNYFSYLEGLQRHQHPRIRLAASAILSSIYDRMDRQDTETESRGIEDRLYQDWTNEDVGFCAAEPDQIAHFQRQMATLSDTADYDEENGVKKMNSAKHRVKKLNPEAHRVKSFDSEEMDRVNVFYPDNNSAHNHTDNVTDKNFDSVTCSSSSFKDLNKTTTTYPTPPRARDVRLADYGHLVFPRLLTPDERRFTLHHLVNFDTETQQQLLDELAGQIESKRHTTTPVRNPVRYLEWMCNQVTAGKSPFSSAGTHYRRSRIVESQRARHTEETMGKRSQGTSDIAGHLDRLAELRKTFPSRKREEP